MEAAEERLDKEIEDLQAELYQLKVTEKNLEIAAREIDRRRMVDAEYLKSN